MNDKFSEKLGAWLAEKREKTVFFRILRPI